MNRIKKIREYLKSYTLDRVHEEIENIIPMRDKYIIPIAKAMLYDALDRQKSQPLWKPSYMGMFHLMPGLITESHEYELTIANQQMYLDEFRVISYWHPDFLYQDEVEEERVRKTLG